MTSILIRIVIFALLGLATTAAMCWVLAVKTNWRGAPSVWRAGSANRFGYSATAPQASWLFTQVDGWGVTEITAATDYGESSDLFDSTSVERVIERDELPSWTAMRDETAVSRETVLYLEEAFGWPMRAMALRHHWNREKGIHHSDSLPLPRFMHRAGPGHWLPIRFIWTGAAVNTALYGWLWFSVVAFPGVLRRFVRRRRGWCSFCGYDLHGTDHERCPECGRGA